MEPSKKSNLSKMAKTTKKLVSKSKITTFGKDKKDDVKSTSTNVNAINQENDLVVKNSFVTADELETNNDVKISGQRGPLISIRSDLLHGYPLIKLTNANFIVKDRSVVQFKIIKYERPLGVAKMASAKVDIFLDTKEIVNETVYFEFDYSELERIVDAKRPTSFKVRPEWFYLFGHDVKTISIDDIIPKYSDVKVLGIRDFISSDTFASFNILFSVGGDKSSKKVNTIKFTIPFDNKNNIVNVIKSDATMQIDVLKSLAYRPEQVQSVFLENVKHYDIDESFVKGTPPQKVDLNIVKPKAYIELLKVDYIPPRDIDSVEAALIVSYRLNQFVIVERVIFRFGGSIRNAVERLLQVESTTNFQYLPKLRRVAPTTMSIDDFVYIGAIPLEIIDVKYDYNLVNPNYRFVDVEVVISYRLVVTKVVKRIEFLYSKDEYISKALNIVFIEENSVDFSKKVLTPQFVYSKLSSAYEFENTKELIRNAKISKDYLYKEITDIKMVNFHPASREFVFRIFAIEEIGNGEQVKVFDKPIKLEWSYEEWLLDQVGDADLHIDPAKIKSFPSIDIDPSFFLPSKLYKVLLVSSDPIANDTKKVELNVVVAAGGRQKQIRKLVVYQYSINEYNQLTDGDFVVGALLGLKPEDISIVIDVNQSAPLQILPEQVLGVPDGVELKIKYRPPHKGKKSTRLVLEFHKDKFMIGFEQTLVFAIES